MGTIIAKVVVSFLIIGLFPFMAATKYVDYASYNDRSLLYKAASAFATLYFIVFAIFIVAVIMGFCIAIVAWLWTI